MRFGRVAVRARRSPRSKGIHELLAQWRNVLSIETADDLRENATPSLVFSPKRSIRQYSVILPVVTGIALLATNRWFTEVDDEIAIVDRAARPLRETMQMFLQGIGQHEHPPLYDVLLHGWLRITNGSEHLLRLPSIIFYMLGAWTLAAAARHLAGDSARNWVLLLLALSPFGFHFGRLATWYSFCFFLVALLTLIYLRFVEQSTTANWLWLAATGLALIYANYFGWALLACLGVDYIVRNRGSEKHSVKLVAVTTAILLFAYIPLFRVLIKEVRFGMGAHAVGLATILNGIFNIYCLFVSESVAPWFWYLGVPAGIAVMTCLTIVFAMSAPVEKKFLSYFVALFCFMTIAGIMEPKRVLFISPWLVMPIGVALAAVRARSVRRVLAVSLAVPAVIGWYGICARNLYAAPRWVEPWEQTARQSALVVEENGIVIGNNPSFFFYLTYLLHAEESQGNARFKGLLPSSVRAAGVYDAGQWIGADHPVAPMIELVKGVHYSISATPTEEAEAWLAQHCNLRSVDRKLSDTGVVWKRRYAPQIDQPEWRVEARTYGCQ